MDVRKDMDSMHPVREDIDRYLRGGLESSHKEQVEQHLRDCDFCREMVDNLKLQLRFASDSLAGDLPQNLEEAAGRVFRQSLRGLIINLILLERPLSGRPALMAADSQLRRTREVEIGRASCRERV